MARNGTPIQSIQAKKNNSDRGGPNRGCILVLAKGLSKSGLFPSKPPFMSMVIARHGFPENSVALDPELTLPNHKGLVLLLSVSSLPLRRSGFGASLGMVVEENYYAWIAGESPVRFLVVSVDNDQPVVPGCAEWLLVVLVVGFNRQKFKLLARDLRTAQLR